MAKEVISLGAGGEIGTEMFGFKGKSCLKAAAEMAAELERLGIVTELGGLQMKDTGEVETITSTTKLKVTEG